MIKVSDLRIDEIKHFWIELLCNGACEIDSFRSNKMPCTTHAQRGLPVNQKPNPAPPNLYPLALHDTAARCLGIIECDNKSLLNKIKLFLHNFIRSDNIWRHITWTVFEGIHAGRNARLSNFHFETWMDC